MKPGDVDAATWSAHCKAESDAKIRAAAYKDLLFNVPETVMLAGKPLEDLVDYILMLDTEGYFYFESQERL